jgi:acyl-CoA hydrolase
MQWIDTAGAVAAMRHANGLVVTASFDRVDFLVPGKLGHIMVLEGQVNYTGRTSMEVGVDVHDEDPMTGKRVLTTRAILTFVAIGKNGKPVPVPPLLPETAEERQRHREAEIRRRKRRPAA